jgi:hypothetical protein
MLPVSATAVGPETNCENTTDAVCGGEGMGCSFKPFLVKEGILPPSGLNPVATPTPSAANGTSGIGRDRSPVVKEPSNRRNVIAAAVAIPFVLVAVSAVVVYFIVLPCVRGATDDTDDGDVPTGAQLATSRSQQAAFEEENNYAELPDDSM